MSHIHSPEQHQTVAPADYANPVLMQRHPARCRSVLMVGTHLTTMGGISTVVRGYAARGLFERFDVHYVATHRDGTGWMKAKAALRGWLRVLVELYRLDEPLVHIHLSSRASAWRKAVVCLLARGARRPYVLHVHGSEFMKFYEQECNASARLFIRRMFRDAALVLALSDEWRANLSRICPTANIEVLTNAVELPRLDRTQDRDTCPPTVLFLGRLGERKGTFDLLNAFAQVADRHPTVRLICAGDGQIDEVRQRAAALGIAPRVECPGWLGTGQARQALAAATLLALPSYAEGLPMSLLEAMSWGLPVIASPVGGIPQVIRHGENGWLVAPGDISGLADAICWMLDHDVERGRLSTAARRTIEQRFSLDASIERLGQIYQRFGVPLRTNLR